MGKPHKLRERSRFTGKIPVEQFIELMKLRASAVYERQSSQADRGTFCWSTKPVLLRDLAPLECGELYDQLVVVDRTKPSSKPKVERRRVPPPDEPAAVTLAMDRFEDKPAELKANPPPAPTEAQRAQAEADLRAHVLLDVARGHSCESCGRTAPPKPTELTRNIACFTCGYDLPARAHTNPDGDTNT